MKIHEFSCVVYNEDIDYSGVVYHANYLKYFERARLNWFEQLGFGLEEQKNEGILYTIRQIELRYLKPARMDDHLNIRTHFEIVGRAKAQLRFLQEIDNLTQQQTCITTANILVVCINEEIKPCSLPKKILEKIDD